jgi:phosphoribosylformimino-5-aminoimidazole carboxamide ribotide isomerase
LTGVDAAAIGGFARSAGLPVIASGGVAGLPDIAALKARARDGVAGIICGRALYDGRLDAAAALRVAEEDARC